MSDSHSNETECCLKNCSSSAVCHLLVTATMYVALFNHTHCQNKVTKVVLKMSDGAVCHLIVTESCCDLTLTQQNSGITRWQTYEEEHFLHFDTFKTRSQLEEHFSTLFKGILCSSSLVCHLVLTILLFFKCQPTNLDSVWSWKVLFFTQSTILWQNHGVTLFWYCLKITIAHLHLSATLLWQWLKVLVTTRWLTGGKKNWFLIIKKKLMGSWYLESQSVHYWGQNLARHAMMLNLELSIPRIYWHFTAVAMSVNWTKVSENVWF